MKNLLPLVTAAAFLAGCPNDPPQQEPPAKLSSSMPANATTASSPSGTTANTSEGRLAPAKPKSYKSTEEQALGTLPDGIGIPVGQTAPDFELPAQAKGPVTLDSLLTKGEVLLVFYRGGW